MRSTAKAHGSEVADVGSDRGQLRPGWTELAVGLVSTTVIAVGLTRIVAPLVDKTTFSLFLLALGPVAAGAAFGLAVLVRIRRPRLFGLRATTKRWLLAGLAGGLVALVLKIPVTALYVALSGDSGNGQSDWASAADTGTAQLVLSLLLLGVLTPIGEELLFRGVVTTVLLRYGPVVGVVGSAVIFAVLHGVLSTMFAAVIVGLIAGELRRRSDSIWPGVMVHVVFNLASAVVAFMVAPALGP